MKEHGIPYSPAMVLARASGTKSQTRRIAKFDAPAGLNLSFSGLEAEHLGGGRWALVSRGAGGCWRERAHAQCPYGVVGDRLWTREAYRTEKGLDPFSPTQIAEKCLEAGYVKPWMPIRYEADGAERNWERVNGDIGAAAERGRYRHARFMPRWASRSLDEITDVRLQRLLSLSSVDAIAEGLIRGADGWRGAPGLASWPDPVEAYRELWESINGAGSWDANPWVWAITFKRVQP